MEAELVQNNTKPPFIDLSQSKPAVRIIVTKGKRYLQIRTGYGRLIHAGPTTNPKSWTIAYMALAEDLSFLATASFLRLVPIARQDLPEGTDLVNLLREAGGMTREEYLAKANRAWGKHKQVLRELMEAGHKFLKYGWWVQAKPDALEE